MGGPVPELPERLRGDATHQFESDLGIADDPHGAREGRSVGRAEDVHRPGHAARHRGARRNRRGRGHDRRRERRAADRERGLGLQVDHGPARRRQGQPRHGGQLVLFPDALRVQRVRRRGQQASGLRSVQPCDQGACRGETGVIGLRRTLLHRGLDGARRDVDRQSRQHQSRQRRVRDLFDRAGGHPERRVVWGGSELLRPSVDRLNPGRRSGRPLPPQGGAQHFSVRHKLHLPADGGEGHGHASRMHVRHQRYPDPHHQERGPRVAQG